MVKADEVFSYVGKRVMLRLTAEAGAGPTLVGRIAGVLPAADGLVVTFEPEGSQPAPRLTYHYHYIESIEPTPGT